MQKLKKCVIDNMIKQKCTSLEVQFILYISKYQDESGCVQGIHYKLTCLDLDMSYQKFYDLKNSLEQKGIIEVNKENYTDWDIRICNNGFLFSSDDRAESVSYLNTNREIFEMDAFKKLKANEKLLAMRFILMYEAAGSKSIRIGYHKFFEIYCNLFGVKKRIMSKYLKKLKEYLFSIGLKDKLYFITPKKHTVKKAATTDMENYNLHAFKAICRRRKVKVTTKTFYDTFYLLKQYAKKGLTIGMLEVAIVKSLKIANESIKNHYKWIKELQPKLIHKLVRNELAERFAYT